MTHRTHTQKEKKKKKKKKAREQGKQVKRWGGYIKAGESWSDVSASQAGLLRLNWATEANRVCSEMSNLGIRAKLESLLFWATLV